MESETFFDKFKQWHFHSLSNEVIWLKNIKLHAGPFLQFFIQGRDGRALLARPLRIPRWISKIIFALDCYEFLSMIEGKTRKGLFF